MSSLRIDTTPTLSASYLTPFSSDRQPPITPLESSFQQKCEKGLDEVFMPPDATIAGQRLYYLTSTQTNDTKERGSLKDDIKVVEIKEQVTGETDVSREEDDGGLIAARTSSSPTSSQSYLIPPHISNSTPKLHQGSTTSFHAHPPTLFLSHQLRRDSAFDASFHPFHSVHLQSLENGH